MAIILKTGVPGTGKTLSLVDELRQLVDKVAAGKAEPRPVYVYRVTGLKLPHQQLPVYPVGGVPGDAIPLDDNGVPTCELTVDWGLVPSGAICVFDEAQHVFPVRGPSKREPEHVKFLNTHRHRNLDIYMLTQGPRLVDKAVRDLVSKHQHYKRAFGWSGAVVYEWGECSPSLAYRAAVKRAFKYPRSVFALYESAEAHTKVAYSLPAWLVIPAVAVPLALFFIPKALGIVFGGSLVKSPIAAAASAPGGIALAGVPTAASAPLAAASEVLQVAPRLTGVPVSAPPSGSLAGCVVFKGQCRCFDAAGYRVYVAPDVCVQSSREYGYLLPYPVTAVAAGAGRSAGLPSVPAGADSSGPGSVSLGGNPRGHVLADAR